MVLQGQGDHPLEGLVQQAEQGHRQCPACWESTLYPWILRQSLGEGPGPEESSGGLPEASVKADLQPAPPLPEALLSWDWILRFCTVPDAKSVQIWVQRGTSSPTWQTWLPPDAQDRESLEPVLPVGLRVPNPGSNWPEGVVRSDYGRCQPAE